VTVYLRPQSMDLDLLVALAGLVLGLTAPAGGVFPGR
jgi:hypothetical protein